jgi:N-acetylneuraminate lyase
MTTLFRGIMPAAITPLDDAGRFVPAAFERLLERVYTAGVDGVYVCGTTGEGMLLSRGDREAVVDAAVACTPAGRHVIVHVGASSIDEALALARHAARAGADAISSMPPTAAPYSFADVRRYYEALAQGSELPLLVYYFPEVTQAIASTDQLEILCAIPNVCGVKFTDFDLFRMAGVRRPGRSVFNGRDEVLAAGLLMGADGGIGSFYNVVPELCVAIQAAADAGRWNDARATQERLNTLIRIAVQFPVFPAIKQMLQWSGLDCGACLSPRPRLDGEQQARLHRELASAGFDDLLAAARPFAPTA